MTLKDYHNIVQGRTMILTASFVLLLAAFFLSFGASYSYATPSDLKIGFVDLRKALMNSKAGIEAKKKLETEQKKAQAEIDGKQKEFTVLKENYDKQKDSLSEKARAEKEDQIMTLEKDLKRNFQDSQEALRRQEAKVLGELIKQIRDVVGEVGKKESFTVILEKGTQMVLYADSQIDITDMVIAKFDTINN